MRTLMLLALQCILLPLWAETPQFEKKVLTTKSGYTLLYRALYPENYNVSAKEISVGTVSTRCRRTGYG